MSWVMNALEMAHGTLVFLAPHTPIKTDDAVVALIEAIKADAGLFRFTSNALDRIDNVAATEGHDGPVYARKAAVSELPQPVLSKESIEALQSRGFGVDDFMQLLPSIIQIIQLFRKKRKD